eukprot:TRINITY_DN63701_c0_g1_i1.p1 TRINITY_DN63701_c0_g1~~TRINITY_DN63701_c0_g1_i1.p1  ORF type:complete len:620 (+),score=141.30 TRINITY_DN63701_c0_g1_i1:131-1861(+)
MAPVDMDDQSWPWSVQDFDTRGRGLVADKGLPAGSTVFAEDPWALALLSKEQGRRCDYSLREPYYEGSNRQLQRCRATGCAYLSKELQRKAWREYYQCEHRACSSTASPAPAPGSQQDLLASLPVAARLALRTLWRDAAGADEAGGGQKRRPWSSLQDHWEDLDAEQEGLRLAQARQLLPILRRGLGESDAMTVHCSPTGKVEDGDEADMVTVAKLMALIDINAMVVTDEEQRGIAVALYPTGAYFNHDDSPNCVHSFVGRRLLVRTLRPVAPGEELTIAYVELAEVSAVRRAKLRQQYFFDPLAKASKALAREVGRRDALLCSVERRGSDGKWSLTASAGFAWSAEKESHLEACTGSPESREVGALLQRVQQLWSRAKKLLDETEDVEAASDALRQAWSAATAGGGGLVPEEAAGLRLGECHALRFQLARDGLDAAIACERWDDALKYARAAAMISYAVYPQAWPVTGLALTRQAKLELYHCNFHAAVAAGEAALQIFAICAADAFEVAQELRQMVAQARAEAEAAGLVLPTTRHPAAPVTLAVGDAKMPQRTGALDGFSPPECKTDGFDLEGLD